MRVVRSVVMLNASSLQDDDRASCTLGHSQVAVASHLRSETLPQGTRPSEDRRQEGDMIR